MGSRDKAEPNSPSLRHLPDDGEPLPCARCGARAVQEITYDRLADSKQYYCFEHAAVVTET